MVTCVVSGAIVLAVSALLTDVVAFIAMKYVSQLVPSRQRHDCGALALNAGTIRGDRGNSKREISFLLAFRNGKFPFYSHSVRVNACECIKLVNA